MAVPVLSGNASVWLAGQEFTQLTAGDNPARSVGLIVPLLSKFQLMTRLGQWIGDGLRMAGESCGRDQRQGCKGSFELGFAWLQVGS